MTRNLLLDTHAFLWWRIGDPRLLRNARQEIATADVVFVSAASAWEAAVKRALGRLRLVRSFAAEVEDAGFEKLAITLEHAEAAGALPPHHRDPFDRMLVAQANLEGLVLVTHDRAIEPYGASVLWI